MGGVRYDAVGVCVRINLVAARTGFFVAGVVVLDVWSWTPNHENLKRLLVALAR
jgi:hypothetical protein